MGRHVKRQFRTKRGKHGTLYLYRIVYRDPDPSCPDFDTRLWAYCREHAEELFHEGSYGCGEADDWAIVSISRVREKALEGLRLEGRK